LEPLALLVPELLVVPMLVLTYLEIVIWQLILV
jgi:hypothetical protein